MLTPTRLSLCFCALLALQGVCPAQKPDDPKAEIQKAEKLDVVASVLPGRSRQIGQAYISYLIEMDRTWANVFLSDVYNLENLNLSMTARIEVWGNKVKRPKNVTFRIFYPKGAAAFAKPPPISIETDEGWLDLGAMRRDHEEKFGLTGPVYKAVAKEVKFELFERIANSKRVNVRVGNVEFGLNEKQGSALRDLLNTIGQQL